MTSRRPNIIFISILAATLLTAAVVGIIVCLARNSYDRVSPQAAASHTIIRSACSSTRFPDLCFDTVAAVNVTTQKDVISATLNVTIAFVRRSYFKVKKLSAGNGLSLREKTALHDCLEMIDETLDELHEAYVDLELYPTKKSLTEHAEDLKTLLSAAMTNKETCLDGFSHDDADKKAQCKGGNIEFGQRIYVVQLDIQGTISFTPEESYIPTTSLLPLKTLTQTCCCEVKHKDDTATTNEFNIFY